MTEPTADAGEEDDGVGVAGAEEAAEEELDLHPAADNRSTAQIKREASFLDGLITTIPLFPFHF